VEALKRVQAKLMHYRAAVLKAAVEGALTADWRAQHPGINSASTLLQSILAERRRRWEEAQLEKFKTAHKEPPKSWKSKYQEPVAPNAANLPVLPKGWCWATVEQLSAPESNSITDGPFGSNLMTMHYTDAGPRVIRLQNIKDGSFADERAHISAQRFARLKKHAVQAGDIVIAGLSESPPRACIVPDLGPAIVKADCIRFKPHKELSARCLCFFLNSLPTRKRMKQIVHGIGRPRLNLSDIRAIALPLAPISEQEVISTEAEDQLSVIDHLKADLDASRPSCRLPSAGRRSSNSTVPRWKSNTATPLRSSRLSRVCWVSYSKAHGATSTTQRSSNSSSSISLIRRTGLACQWM
jgi:type I restriction enzyme S subunit